MPAVRFNCSCPARISLSPLPQDIRADLKLAKQGPRSPYYREYVLPDGVSNFRGYVRVSLHNQNLHASMAFFHWHGFKRNGNGNGKPNGSKSQ